LSALQAHPFFRSLSWDALWSDPVPPIASGILKSQAYSPESVAFDAGTEDERQADMETNRVENVQEHTGIKPTENGESDVIHEGNSSSGFDIAGLEREAHRSKGSPSPPTGSSAMELHDMTSSYDDSPSSDNPTGRLGGILESLTLSSRSRRPSATSDSSTLSDPARWMPLLRPSETPVFTSCVLKSTRRAFPRQLLPLTGGAKKGLNAQGSKARLLVLTKTRLLCMKEHDGELVVKNEMLIGGQGGGIGVVTGVEKGDQTFVVQTVSSSDHLFAASITTRLLSRSRSRTPT
jgi:hypothetical protein